MSWYRWFGLAPWAKGRGGLGRAVLAGSVSATLLLFGMATSASAAAGPSLTVVSPTAGQKVTSTDIPVQVSTSGIDTSCKWVGTPDKAGQGHIHAMLDGMSMAHLSNFYCGMDHFTISGEGVSPGQHTLIVDLASNTHMDMDKTAQEIKFDYAPATPKPLPAAASTTGTPAVHITSPQDGATVGPTFTLGLSANNFTPSCDLEGKQNVVGDGHYHVFVDMPPASSSSGMMSLAGMIGMPCSSIPVDLSAWPSGKHTITVELANNDHTPQMAAKPAMITITLNNGGVPGHLPSSGGGGLFLLPRLAALGALFLATGGLIGHRRQALRR